MSISELTVKWQMIQYQCYLLIREQGVQGSTHRESDEDVGEHSIMGNVVVTSNLAVKYDYVEIMRTDGFDERIYH